MNEPSTDRSIDVLDRMLDDARTLSGSNDPVLAPRVAFLVAFLTETLDLKRPR
jgi:hypothetical protein